MEEADNAVAAPEVSDEPLVEAPGEEEPLEAEEPDTPQSLDLAVESEAAAGTVLETAFHVSSVEAASPGVEAEGGEGSAAALLRDAVARFSLESAGAAFGEDEALLDDGLDGDSVVVLSASHGSSADDDAEPALPPADAAQQRLHSSSSAVSRPRSSQPRPSSARDARPSGTARRSTASVAAAAPLSPPLSRRSSVQSAGALSRRSSGVVNGTADGR